MLAGQFSNGSELVALVQRTGRVGRATKQDSSGARSQSFLDHLRSDRPVSFGGRDRYQFDTSGSEDAIVRCVERFRHQNAVTGVGRGQNRERQCLARTAGGDYLLG
jgi:hypothetical protein